MALNFPDPSASPWTDPNGIVWIHDGDGWAVECNGSGGGGTDDHTLLINRDSPDQHTVAAITGLQANLDAKENSLGNPSTDNYVLSSLADGTRAWVVSDSGPQGPAGIDATAAVNSTTTGAPGSNATVTDIDPSVNAINLDFVIPRGDTGADGADGADGAQGPAGNDGVDGTNGIDGIDGADGSIGPEGPTAVSTDTGNQAIISTNDNLIYVPVNAGASTIFQEAKPDETLYAEGQEWVRTSDMVKFSLYDDAGTLKWIDNGNGQPGPQGNDGADGTDGIDGNDGAQGPAGNDGVDGSIGPQGDDGIQGIQGIQGPIGDTGSQGPQGADGNDGVQGPQGIQGPVGDTGSQGPIGPDGADGIQGPAGNDGSIGPQGIQGVPGNDGSDGVDGSQGPQGIQGIPGNDGADGNDGVDGSVGPEGPTAVSADAGNQAIISSNDNLIYVPASAGGGAITGYKNILINGLFRVDQRDFYVGSSGDWGTRSIGEYGPDRWRLASNVLNMEQVVEEKNFTPGVIHTLSTDQGSSQITSPATGDWTITVPNNILWAQLELGSVATGFEIRPVGLELTLCQRYYWDSDEIYTTGCTISSTTIDSAAIQFPVTMYRAPDITTMSVVGVADDRWSFLGVAYSAATTAPMNINKSRVTIRLSEGGGADLGQGYNVAGRLTANAEFI